MRINLDPMPAARAAMVDRINAHFANLAISNMQREQAWRRKREIATAVVAGEDCTFAFAVDAQRAGLDVIAFADFILAKQDPAELADAREEARQQLLHAVAWATSPTELQAIAAGL
jgi:hypothetical protein